MGVAFLEGDEEDTGLVDIQSIEKNSALDGKDIHLGKVLPTNEVKNPALKTF